MKHLLILTAALLSLGACRGGDIPRTFQGSKQVWSLHTLNGAIFPTTATFAIPKAGEINGQAPCNRYFGALSGPYPAFKAGPIGSTKMGCPELSAELAFLDALQAATTAEVIKDRLILSNSNGLEMVFTQID